MLNNYFVQWKDPITNRWDSISVHWWLYFARRSLFKRVSNPKSVTSWRIVRVKDDFSACVVIEVNVSYPEKERQIREMIRARNLSVSSSI